MDLETDTLLRGSLRQALAPASGTSVDDRLDELGWDEVVEEDEAAAVRLLFEEHGSLLAVSSVLDRVMMRSGGEALRGCTRILHAVPAAAAETEASQHCLRIALAELAADDRPVLYSRRGGQSTVLAVRPSALGRTRTTISGLDPKIGWAVHEVDLDAATLIAAGEQADRLWESVVAAGRRALASELVGVSRAVLDLAVEHVRVRTQFGKPIGAFQAVRHRLAEAYAYTAGADAMVDASWHDKDAWSAESAKAFAGQAHVVVTRHAMQVCGALGLTWEHGLHDYIRRGFVLDMLLGSERSLVGAAGSRLLGGQEPPRICRF